MNRDVIELREVIQKLVPLLAGKGLTVTQRGSRAYVQTNPRTKQPEVVNIPNIADNADAEFISAIQGFIDHEVGHVLFTNWHFYGGKGGMSEKDLADPKRRAFMNTHNIIEDVMIEKEMIKVFPGSARNISNTRKWFLEKITIKALNSTKDEREHFRFLLVPMMRALGGHEEMQEFMSAGNWWTNTYVDHLLKAMKSETLKLLKDATTTEQTLVIAEEVHDIITGKTPPKPEEQPEPEESESQKQEESGDKDGESEDKPEKKADEGDGDGERDHEQSDDSKETDEEAGDDDEDGKNGTGKENDDEGALEDEDESDDQGDEADDGDADGKPSSGDDEDEEKGDTGEEDKGGEGSDEGDDQDSESTAGDSDGQDDDDDAEEEDDSEEAEEGQSGDSSDGGSPENEAEEGEDDAQGTSGVAGEDASLDEDIEEEGRRNEVSPVTTAGASGGGVGDVDAEDTGEHQGGGGGVGNAGAKSVFDYKDDEFEEVDMSAQIAIKITESAIESMDPKQYLVFTREMDRIEPITPPSNLDPKWVPKMEDDVRLMTAKMQKDIERMMASQSHIIRTPGHRNGKLHSPSLFRVPSGDPRVFTQKQEHKSKDTAVSLVIDNSGSMGGEKMRLAMIAGYALSATLDRVKIAHEVIGFTTGGFYASLPPAIREALAEDQRRNRINWDRVTPIVMPIYKTFDERISSLVKERFAFMMNAQPGLNGNIDGESVQYAAERLIKRMERRKVMLVLSDGQPAGSRKCGPHLKHTVSQLEKMGIECVGIGIKDDSVKHYYSKFTVLNVAEDLPTQVMSEIKKILM